MKTDLFAASAVATPPSEIPVLQFNSQVTVEETATGSHILRGLRIFKEGTFKNSWGEEGTWEAIHLDQMILHYNFLKENNFLSDVPVRVDHSNSVDSVAGYFQSLYRDPVEPTFLAADVEITEPDAYEKWERRTFRARSLEVGAYETNDGSLFWPVVLGLAFVDIPAIEGLHADGANREPMTFSHFITDKENRTMADKPKDDNKGSEQLPADSKPAEGEHSAPPAPKTTNDPPTPDPAPAADHGAPAPSTVPPVQTYRVDGSVTTDPAEVQKHIDTLEQFRVEVTDSTRDDFVEELAEDGKIAATQIEGLQEHCRSLTAEQFTAFRGLYENAEAPPATGPQATPGAGGVDPENVKPEQEAFEIASGIVAQHQRAGMKPEKIKDTDSYKTLERLADSVGKPVPVLN